MLLGMRLARRGGKRRGREKEGGRGKREVEAGETGSLLNGSLFAGQVMTI